MSNGTVKKFQDLDSKAEYAYKFYLNKGYTPEQSSAIVGNIIRESNFDTSVVGSESGEVIKAVVTFVVERDGTISNIKAAGANADFNKEAEKVIKSIKGKWNPAKLGGQNVRSYFRFPISMQFE